MVASIDFNSDMGESYGLYRYGEDEQILPYITSINLACGFHGGDPGVMRKTVELAKKKGLGIGAHPGLPDILGFGRRYIEVAPQDLYDYVLYQIGALSGFMKHAGLNLSHVKPHGAIYMMVLDHEDLSKALCQAIYDFDSSLPIYTIAGSVTEKVAEDIGLSVVPEYFADRPYTEKGVKMFGWTRDEIGSPEDIAGRVLEVVRSGSVTGLGGVKVPIHAQTICVHSDTPNSAQIVRTINETLTDAGVELKAPHNLVRQ